MKQITCIEDLREIHRRRVPKMFFDYVDHGSYAEETLRANRDDLKKIKALGGTLLFEGENQREVSFILSPDAGAQPGMRVK